MKKQDIERALRRASEQLPAVNYEKAAHTPVTRMEIHDHITRQSPALHRPRRWAPLLAVLLLLLLLGGGWYYWSFRMVYSTVYLHAHHSFSITLNRMDRVLDVEAGNDDAEELLDGRSYANWSAKAVLGILASELAASGDLPAAEDVSLWVESRSPERAQALEAEATALFAARASDPLPSPEPPLPTPTPTLTPTPTPTPTPAPTPTPTQPGHHGEDKPAGWERITPKEAQAVVLAQAPSAQFHETTLDENDDGTWVYEIECSVDEEKYDAQVDAITGALLKWERDD